MVALILCASLGLGSGWQTATVDMVEVNNVYDPETYKLTLRQLIFYDYNPQSQRMEIVDVDGSCFILLEKHNVLDLWPTKIGSLYIVKLRGRQREIKARMFRETWTTHDREVAKKTWVKFDDMRLLFPLR